MNKLITLDNSVIVCCSHTWHNNNGHISSLMNIRAAVFVKQNPPVLLHLLSEASHDVKDSDNERYCNAVSSWWKPGVMKRVCLNECWEGDTWVKLECVTVTLTVNRNPVSMALEV